MRNFYVSPLISDGIDQTQTRNKVRALMIEIGAVRLNVSPGVRNTQLTTESWGVGTEVVIVQYYPDGGCSHYVQGAGNTWEAMSTQLHQIAAKAV